MGRRLAVHAGPHRQALIAAVLALACGSATAAPKSKPAKVQFEAGVAAYKTNDYAGASTAFGKSFAIEADVETLFAWAQAERKQGHCDKASELYVKLLAGKLPAANKTVVQGQLDECKRILDDETAAKAAAAKAEANAAANAAAKAAAKTQADADAQAKAQAAKPTPPAPHVDAPAVVQPTPEPIEPTPEGPKPWFKDALGDTLVGAGLISGGIGVAMLISGHSAEQSSHTATDYASFKAFDDKAKSRGKVGVIAGAAGAALIVGGVIRYATRSTTEEHTTITGWLDSKAGGFAVTGAF
jgi:hypothetical protein